MEKKYNIKCFLLTRFNLKLWPHNKHREEVWNEDWLKHRCDLFERFCLPSVCNQSVMEFKWIVLFDAQSPDWMVKRVESWKKQCGVFIPRFVNRPFHRSYSEVFKKRILHEIGTEECRIVTTYLDNDDSLNSTYVEAVISLSKSVDSRTYISFVNGAQYFTDLRLMNTIRYRNNHFISYVCDYDGVSQEKIRVVYEGRGHYYIDRQKSHKIRYVENKEPMWCEVVHDKNVFNDVWPTVYTKPVLDRGFLMSGFNVDVCLGSFPVVRFCTLFIWRVLTQIPVRIRYKLFGVNWWG